MTCPFVSTVMFISDESKWCEKVPYSRVSLLQPCSDIIETTETGSSLGERSAGRTTDPGQGLWHQSLVSEYSEGDKGQEDHSWDCYGRSRNEDLSKVVYYPMHLDQSVQKRGHVSCDIRRVWKKEDFIVKLKKGRKSIDVAW
jgi:hypothetical protein